MSVQRRLRRGRWKGAFLSVDGATVTGMFVGTPFRLQRKSHRYSCPPLWIDPTDYRFRPALWVHERTHSSALPPIQRRTKCMAAIRIAPKGLSYASFQYVRGYRQFRRAVRKIAREIGPGAIVRINDKYMCKTK